VVDPMLGFLFGGWLPRVGRSSPRRVVLFIVTQLDFNGLAVT
jgi:hypothetical protein